MILHLGDGPPRWMTWPSPLSAHPISAAKEASQHSWSRYFQDSPGPPYLSGSVTTLSRLISRLISRPNKADLGTCGQRPWWERRFDIPIIIKVRKRATPPKHPNQTAFCPTKRFIKLPANLWRNPKHCHSGQKGTQPKETAMGNKKNQPNTHTHNLSRSASKQ